MPSEPVGGHPGPHIREKILPKRMSVTKAARLLNVGRPALSNLLNGRAALSPEMAARIERAFGADAQKLVDMQAAHDATVARQRAGAASIGAFVPPFLQIKANQIVDWATSISARSRFAVLLRTLIHSTGRQIVEVDFPGNDDSQRPGWDGYLETNEATPWVPFGKSGWEFGANQEPKRKADRDYAKSVRRVSPKERKEITFVFVTPRRWTGKTRWRESRCAEKQWKDVRVLDASDLEQWLELSIPGQAWLAHEIGVPSQGVQSLEACWRNWAADCDRAPVPGLFDEAVSAATKTISSKLANPTNEPVVITADSRGEALAFLNCLFSADASELGDLKDRVVVFSEPGPLKRLASKGANFIPVIVSHSVEQELAPHRAALPAILVHPRNTTNVEADVTLEPLSNKAFESALQQMDCSRDDIDRLARESGRSLTVLRRRLSRLDAVRTPEWAADGEHSASLIPFLWAGAWNADNAADQTVLSLLGGVMDYSSLERTIASLVQLEDAPMWSIGSFRGLVSKLDTLFAICRHVTQEDLERFFDAASLVLSEDDPSLDLPEEDRWAAGLHGKTRETSAALRNGISETLVLLAVHGQALFRGRLGLEPESEARRLVRGLLSHVTARKLEAQSDDLPTYAEAAPDEFLDIIDADLKSPNPEVLTLMRPASSGLLGRCPRTGLLWALENTAWAPERLVRTVDILARLAGTDIDDNWLNKPSSSLSAIFRCWVPQTAANLDQRIAALEYLVEHYPSVAWKLCAEQFDGRSTVGAYSHKPRWRPDAHGYGERVSRTEQRGFARRALEIALDWKMHTRQTLGDLIETFRWMDDADQDRVWDHVEEWSRTASDEDRAWLREKVRRSTGTRRQRGNAEVEEAAARTADVARRMYEVLKPSDLVFEHAWLFRRPWIEDFVEKDGEFDFEDRERRIIQTRTDALREVVADRGVDGALALARTGDAAYIVGRLLCGVLASVDEQIEAVRLALGNEPDLAEQKHQLVVSGLLGCLPDDDLIQALSCLADGVHPADSASVVVLAPFKRATWRFVERLGGVVEMAYWRDANAEWGGHEGPDLVYAVVRLLGADRPRAAFNFADLGLSQLPPRLLFRLIKAIAAGSGEAAGTYQLQRYALGKAFDILNKSGEIASDEMAALEFTYLSVLGREEGGVPNLEEQINENPEMFVHAVAFLYRRSDGCEDPEELRAENPEVAESRAAAAYRLLEALSQVPGRNQQGEVEKDDLLEWVEGARAASSELGRLDVCDIQIGELLAKAPFGEDGAWPCEPVRNVVETIESEPLLDGIKTGLYNARGPHWRGEGGGQERELAAKYEGWARPMAFQYPTVARLLTDMARRYEAEASWQDTRSDIGRRLQ